MSKYRRSLHLKYFHSENPPTDTTCVACNKRFTTKTGLRHHIAMVHMNQRQYQCHSCEKRFYSKKDCDNHERQKHSDDKDKFSCERCGAVFGYKSSLNRHMESCMIEDAVYQCPECLKWFRSKGSLYSHTRGKHSNLSFVCVKCGKTYERQYSYQRHMKTCE